MEARSARSSTSLPPQPGQVSWLTGLTGTSTGGSVISSSFGAWRKEKVPEPGLRAGRLGWLTRMPLEKGDHLALVASLELRILGLQRLQAGAQLGDLPL
jgi:hypothetical protein